MYGLCFLDTPRWAFKGEHHSFLLLSFVIHAHGAVHPLDCLFFLPPHPLPNMGSLQHFTVVLYLAVTLVIGWAQLEVGGCSALLKISPHTTVLRYPRWSRGNWLDPELRHLMVCVGACVVLEFKFRTKPWHLTAVEHTLQQTELLFLLLLSSHPAVYIACKVRIIQYLYLWHFGQINMFKNICRLP